MRTKSLAPFLAGLTQQALATRAAPGVTAVSNVDFSPLRGATKRSPARYVAELQSGTPPDYQMRFWERGDGSTYVAGVSASAVKVWNAETGAEFFLDDAVGDFDYLAGVADHADYVLQPAGDFLFVLNKTKTVGKLSTTSGSRPTPGYGFFFASRGNYDRDYVVRFKVAGVEYSYTCNTYAAVGTAFAGPLGPVGTGSINSIKTEDIAEDLRLQINAASGSHGLVATRVGSVVKLAGPVAMTALTTSDGEGDTALIAMLQSVEQVSNLPTTCEDGFRIKITGEGESAANDFFVQFVTTEPSGFGHGYWREAVGYDVETDLDQSTMPHALTRMLDDALGTVTGTPNEEYFKWDVVTWDPRDAGDAETNQWPSFLDHEIDGIFHWQDRLGFLSAENIIMSETSSPFNFFRTTLRDLIDSDMIDASQSGPTVSIFHAAVPHEDALVLFSRFATFVGGFEGLLSPKTFFIREIGASESDPGVLPVPVGRSLFFAQARGDFVALRELVRSGDSFRFAQGDATAAVPSFVTGPADKLAGASSSDLVLVLTDADQSSLFVHRFLWNGDTKVQAAWTRYDFSLPISGFGVVGGELKIAFSRGVGGLHLEAMTLNVDQKDEDSDWLTCIDHRVDDASTGVVLTFDGGNNSTTIDIPYSLVSGETASVVTKDGAEVAVLEQSTAGAAGFIRVAGDKTAEDLWIGIEYDARFTIGNPVLRDPTESGKYGSSDPLAQVLGGAFQHSDSGPFTVTVDFADGRQFSSVAASAVGGVGSVVGEAVLLTGAHIFSVLGREDQVSVTASSAGPIQFSIQGVSWTHRASFRARGRY